MLNLWSSPNTFGCSLWWCSTIQSVGDGDIPQFWTTHVFLYLDVHSTNRKWFNPYITPISSQDIPQDISHLTGGRSHINMSTHSTSNIYIYNVNRIHIYIYLSGWWFQPLWKIWVRQLGWWLFPIFLENHKIHVPNHQPAIAMVYGYGYYPWP